LLGVFEFVFEELLLLLLLLLFSAFSLVSTSVASDALMPCERAKAKTPAVSASATTTAQKRVHLSERLIFFCIISSGVN